MLFFRKVIFLIQNGFWNEFKSAKNSILCVNLLFCGVFSGCYNCKWIPSQHINLVTLTALSRITFLELFASHNSEHLFNHLFNRLNKLCWICTPFPVTTSVFVKFIKFQTFFRWFNYVDAMLLLSVQFFLLDKKPWEIYYFECFSSRPIQQNQHQFTTLQ